MRHCATAAAVAATAGTHPTPAEPRLGRSMKTGLEKLPSQTPRYGDIILQRNQPLSSNDVAPLRSGNRGFALRSDEERDRLPGVARLSHGARP